MSGARIVFLGHATVLIELDGTRLLTDPVLGNWIGPLRRHGPEAARALGGALGAVLSAHLQPDPLDLRSLRHAARGTPLIVPAGTGPFFAAKGFAEAIELAP